MTRPTPDHDPELDLVLERMGFHDGWYACLDQLVELDRTL